MTDYSKAQRASSQKKGHAQAPLHKGGKARFPINNLNDLKNAKRAVGRSKTPGSTRAYINRRAAALGAPPIGGKKKKGK